jgi:hypothetical protein
MKEIELKTEKNSVTVMGKVFPLSVTYFLVAQDHDESNEEITKKIESGDFAYTKGHGIRITEISEDDAPESFHLTSSRSDELLPTDYLKIPSKIRNHFEQDIEPTVFNEVVSKLYRKMMDGNKVDFCRILTSRPDGDMSKKGGLISANLHSGEKNMTSEAMEFFLSPSVFGDAKDILFLAPKLDAKGNIRSSEKNICIEVSEVKSEYIDITGEITLEKTGNDESGNSIFLLETTVFKDGKEVEERPIEVVAESSVLDPRNKDGLIIYTNLKNIKTYIGDRLCILNDFSVVSGNKYTQNAMGSVIVKSSLYDGLLQEFGLEQHTKDAMPNPTGGDKKFFYKTADGELSLETGADDECLHEVEGEEAHCIRIGNCCIRGEENVVGQFTRALYDTAVQCIAISYGINDF